MMRFTALFVALGLLGGCTAAERPAAKAAGVPRLVAASFVDGASADVEDDYGLGMRAALPLYAPEPEYPEQERLAGVEAKVTVSYQIGEDGRVAGARASGPKAFREKALEALARWRFQPATRDGTPLSSRRITEFSFRVRA